MKFIPMLLRIAALVTVAVGSFLPSVASAQTLPSVIQEEENPIPFYGTWTLDGQVYNAVWNNGALATLTVQSFTPASVIIDRTDIPGSVSYGMTAVYTGQISSAGNSILNGSVTWTWPGHYGYPATGSWSAYWSLPTPQITFVDPVPQLIRSGAVIPTGDPDDDNLLATLGRVVTGAAADGVTEVLVRISGVNVGDQLTLTLLNDAGQPSGSANDDGALGMPGDPNFFANNVIVTAASTSQGPMGFAVYRAPIDFPRPAKDQDQTSSSRSVSIQVQPPTGTAVVAPVTVLRPPVVLIHGIWSSASDTWGQFSPLYTDGVSGDSRFFVLAVDYSYLVGYFELGSDKIRVRANALGFDYNATRILSQLRSAISIFKNGNNPANIKTAAVQADVVGHSMGGVITRTFAVTSKSYTFLSDDNFKSGDVHKLITIDTPHLGTPVATQLLRSENECVAHLMDHAGNAVIPVILLNGDQISGAANDLSGDGNGNHPSQALANLKIENGMFRFRTALIAAKEDSSNLSGLDQCIACLATIAKYACLDSPLTGYMFAFRWQEIFSVGYDSPGDDALVPFVSQLNNTSNDNPAQAFDGLIHSHGTELLGFNGPSIMDDPYHAVPNEVIDLLNTTITNPSIFVPLTP
jgi:pimeloyl-ACP methyl ester carboxylesterase